MLAHTGKFDAYPVYLILSFAYGQATATIFTVNLLYQFEIAHLSPLQLVLVGTVLESVCFLCQVPTGALADLYSRRLAVIAGVFIIGLGFVLEGLLPNFGAIALAMVFYGVGATLMSGAEEAWLAGELGEEHVGRAFLRGSQFSQAGSMLGALLSVTLATLRLNVPVVTGGCLLVLLSLFLALAMPEHGFQPTPGAERRSWRAFADTLCGGLRTAWKSPILLLILGVSLCYGLSSEGFDRLWTPHLQSDFSIPPLGPFAPVTWFGVISVLGNLLVIAGTEIVRRFLNPNQQRPLLRVLMALNVMGLLGLLLLAFTGNFFLAVTALWCVSVFRGVQGPLTMSWLVQNCRAEVRATLVSLQGQMDALGQIVGGPPIGYLGTVFSLRVALAAVSAILAPALLLYAAALRRLCPDPPA